MVTFSNILFSNIIIHIPLYISLAFEFTGYYRFFRFDLHYIYIVLDLNTCFLYVILLKC